jgi:NADH-quinone oxidoreductase subunit E
MALRRFDLDAGGDSFAFKPETEEKIAFWRGKYPADKQRSAVIPLLWLAQKDNNGWLSEPAMREVADRLEMPYIRVYEVATFYTMFRLQPVGKFHVQLCGTTPCQLRGAEGLKEVCTKEIGKPMHVTDDQRLSWEEVECLGACVNAPMVQINDDFYECLTPASIVTVLEACKAGKPIPMTKWGSRPMNGQLSCEGPLGKTSLFAPRVEPVPTRELKAKVDPASVKKHMMY